MAAPALEILIARNPSPCMMCGNPGWPVETFDGENVCEAFFGPFCAHVQPVRILNIDAMAEAMEEPP